VVHSSIDPAVFLNYGGKYCLPLRDVRDPRSLGHIPNPEKSGSPAGLPGPVGRILLVSIYPIDVYVLVVFYVLIRSQSWSCYAWAIALCVRGGQIRYFTRPRIFKFVSQSKVFSLHNINSTSLSLLLLIFCVLSISLLLLNSRV
jgi:hypothetical protein